MIKSNSTRKTQKFILLFVSIILSGLASALTFRLIPLQLLGESFTAKQTVQTLSLGSLISIPFALFGGWFSDKVGRPIAILIALIAVFIAMLGNHLMIFYPAGSVLPSIYILSIAFDTVTAIGFWAFVIENSTLNHRGLFFALVMGIKGFLYQHFNRFGTGFLNRIDFLLTINIGLVVFLIAIGLLIWLVIWEQRNPDFFSGTTKKEFTIQNQMGQLSVASILKWLIAIYVISQFGFGVANLNGAQGLANMSDMLGLEFKQHVVLLRAQYAYDGSILTIGIMLLFGWLSDKFGERSVLTFTILGIGVLGTVPFLVGRSFYGLGLQILSAGFCSIAISPGFNSMLSKIIPDRKTGLGYGIFTAVSSVSFLLLFPLQNFLSERPQSIALVLFTTFLITGILIWLKFRLPGLPTEPDKELMVAG